MKKSTPHLRAVLEILEQKARGLGLSDTEWATRAGIRKETLSRLRGRRSCDFVTLLTLAGVVGASVGVTDGNVPGSTKDGLFPAQFRREYEEQLLDLCASGVLEPARWRHCG